MDNVYTFTDRETIEMEAREWLIKLDGEDHLSHRDRAALREWANRSPAHREELQRISAFWTDANILTELAIPLHSVGRASARQNARQSQHRPSPFTRLLTGLLAFKRPGAAMAVGLLGIAIAVTTWLFPQSLTATNGIYATAIGEVQVQTLADGSVIHINTDSQVQVDYSEDVRKIRLLRGEAHFKVTKDPDRPFEVHARDGLVKAVGTAFSVRLDLEDVKVTVTEGRVDLAALLDEPNQTEKAAWQPENSTQTKERTKSTSQSQHQSRLAKIGTLGRGQSATFNDRVTPTAQTSETDKPEAATDSVINSTLKIETLPEPEITRRLAWRDGYLVFAGEPLSDVVDEVNRYTPTIIEIADPALGKLKIGGRFKVGELEALYDVLEASFGIEVSRLNDQHIQLRPRG